jgi:hypothetical protein
MSGQQVSEQIFHAATISLSTCGRGLREKITRGGEERRSQGFPCRLEVLMQSDISGEDSTATRPIKVSESIRPLSRRGDVGAVYCSQSCGIYDSPSKHFVTSISKP